MKSLNFISDSENIALESELRVSEWQRASVIFCLIAILVTVIVRVNLFLIEDHNRDLQIQLAAARQSQASGQSNSLEDSIRTYNSRAKIVSEAISARVPWSDRLSSLTQSIPAGVELDQMGLNETDQSVIFRGRAQDRSSYLSLKNSLEKTGWFNEIELPITDLLSRETIQFNFKTTLDPSFFKLD